MYIYYFLLVQPLYTLLLFREFTLLFIALPFIITVFLLAKNVHIVRIVKCELAYAGKRRALRTLRESEREREFEAHYGIYAVYRMCHFNMRVSGVCILYESNCLQFLRSCTFIQFWLSATES